MKMWCLLTGHKWKEHKIEGAPVVKRCLNCSDWKMRKSEEPFFWCDIEGCENKVITTPNYGNYHYNHDRAEFFCEECCRKYDKPFHTLEDDKNTPVKGEYR